MAFDVTNNPFAVLTAVAAPAILTNACSVLALGTGNRIARVVDRTRNVFVQQSALTPESPAYQAYTSQLGHLRVRAKLLLRALRLFYTALAMFASTALTAIIGSALVAYQAEFAFHVAAVFGLLVGSIGVIAIVFGCSFMIHETRLAITTLSDEHAAAVAALKK